MIEGMPRTRLLASSPSSELRLGFYPPECAQAPHSHDVPVVSLVVAGMVSESVGTRETVARPGWLSVKPPGVRHSDGYGRDGAIILSAPVRDPRLWNAGVASPEWRWRPLSSGIAAQIVTSARHAESSDDVVADMLAATEDNGALPAIPLWLKRVAQRLYEEPALPISTIAAEAAVHRVHLARAFRRHFGTTPRAFRLAAKLSRGLGLALFDRVGGTFAAHGGGFADESHMVRTLKQSTGFSLAELRRLIGH